jgi:hypothetical protein
VTPREIPGGMGLAAGPGHRLHVPQARQENSVYLRYLIHALGFLAQGATALWLLQLQNYISHAYARGKVRMCKVAVIPEPDVAICGTPIKLGSVIYCAHAMDRLRFDFACQGRGQG